MDTKQNSVYRFIWRDAFKFTWRNKYLWILALLAMFFSNIGVVSHLLKYKDYVQAGADIFAWDNFVKYFLSLFKLDFWQDLFMTSWPIGILAFVLTGALVLILVWLSVNSQIGIAESVKHYVQGLKGQLSREQLLGKAQNKFLPVLFINILRQGLIFLIGGAIAVPCLLYLYNSDVFGLYYYVALAAVLFLLSIISFVAFYMFAYVVIYNKSLGQALKSAEALFSKNWLVSLEMALFLFFVEIFIVLLMNAFFLFILLAIFWLLQIQSAFLVLSLVVLVFIFAIFTIFLMAWLYNFQFASWLLLFLRLQDGSASSKSSRLLKKILSKKKK
ncbi:MAG TPA: hypothetical protein PLB38_00545 [bacterium]|nr:hypothetical protein [bacterium]